MKQGIYAIVKAACCAGAITALSSSFPQERNLQTMADSIILEMNFEDSNIKNEITGKTYKSNSSTWKSVASTKGLGFQFNNDFFQIPSSDLNLTANDQVVTVSFLLEYRKDSDNLMYPISLGGYNLAITDKYIGFNTFNNDIYGFSHGFKDGVTYHIVAQFTKGDVTKNKIYIDGVSKSLAHLLAGRPNTANAVFGEGLMIGNIQRTSEAKYRWNARAIIDEIMIFKRSFTSAEAQKLALAHRIPELYLKEKSGNVELEWAVEILESDTIYKFDFEAGEVIPDFTWKPNKVGDLTGGQKIVTNQFYRGLRSVLLPRTYDAMGNNYNNSQTSSNQNIMSYGRLYAPSGTRLSVAFRAKSTSGTNYITAVGDGGFSDVVYWHPTAKLAKDAKEGDRSIVVTDINGIELWTNIEVTSSRSNFPSGNPPNVTKITKNSDGTYTLNLEWGIMSSATKGSRVGYRVWRDVWAFDEEEVTNTKWRLYNSNTTVFNNSDYNVQKRGGSFHIRSKNEATVYLDDVRFGYATRVNLYRDGVLIYDGYNSSFTDEGPRDKGKPVLGNISATANSETKKITVDVTNSYDTGTTYNYQIKSIGRSGEQTFKSKNYPLEMKSGLQGYSYVLDKNPTTTPNSVVDSKTGKLQFDISGPGTYYLHIKAIDNLGNSSDVKHVKIVAPNLTAKANSLEDMIRLDWTGMESSTYKVYQKRPGSDAFETISTTDFVTKTQVNVLNVYPYVSGKTINFTTWDGESVSLPQSAILKQWMEEPNAEHPKGYGQGMIEVTPVDIDSFNLNPEWYLKDSQGNYQYDVIVFGIADSWGNDDGLSELAEKVVDEYVSKGYGLLLGHDTAYRTRAVIPNLAYGFSRLAEKYLDMNILNLSSSDLVLDNFFNGNDPSASTSYGGHSIVQTHRKGLLTNYPWEIGEIGTNLTIPYTHNAFQKTGRGEIWMRFNWQDTGLDNPFNSYLYTYNNAAMIQTGHSIASGSNAATIATPDEQKVLANTLFYLNQLSMNNYLDDYSGQDVAAPTMPNFLSSSVSEDGKLVMKFEGSTDIGSTYEYYIEAKSNDGNFAVTSNKAQATVLTGLKGYSYVVDSNSKTIPDNKVEITKLDEITFNRSDLGKYLHVKAVDNGRGDGNASETLHIKIEGLLLEATPKPDKNMIRLDWGEVEESIYKVYQKKPGSTAFQTISSTDFQATTKVKVLNVHPNEGETKTCTTWTGEKVSAPASANLKCWMEAPNSLSAKGYGKGIIEVDIVTIEDFSANPSSYMKTTGGAWRYDVVMFGTWDANDYKDISSSAKSVIDQFLSEGRGVLFGHDTANSNNEWENFTYLGTKYCNLVHSKVDSPRVSKIVVTRRGLLTNYPWDIGELGKELTIPTTHSYGQDAYGDIWMRYSGGAQNRNDFYLTSWNNCAMIQTGHSNGAATEDEQKLLANTLFYLNQLSANNYLDDYSGQDVAAPTTPTIKNVTFTMDNKINIQVNASTDNGSTYSYYVKAENKNGGKTQTSNTVTATITTGLAGYSYVVDSSPTTTPDNVVDTTSAQVQIPTNNTSKYYFHIKAVDKAGNASEVVHYELTDMTNPTLIVTADKTQWTNTNVVLTAQSTDKESGLKYIYLPNGNKVSQVTSQSYTVSQNGSYVFKAEDYMGNIQTVTKSVANIDKVLPTGSIRISKGEGKLPSEETTITFNYQDTLSGVSKVEVYDLDGSGRAITPYHVINNPSDSGRTTQWVLKPYDDPNNSSIKKARVGMRITDKAGNTSTYTSQEVIIESIEITGFSLTNVVNPEVYNNKNPFVELHYPNIPVQKMLSGGSFDFKVKYRYSNTIPTTYKMDYKATVYLIGNGYNKSYPIVMKNQNLSGVFEMDFEIPFDVPIGTGVFIEVGIDLKTAAGVLYGTDSFPKPTGTRLQIGVIDNDIRNLIKFNEIK